MQAECALTGLCFVASGQNGIATAEESSSIGIIAVVAAIVVTGIGVIVFVVLSKWKCWKKAKLTEK